MAKFNTDLNVIFSTLADPTRRDVVTRLTRGPAATSELAAPFDMALPTFMAHLRRLEEAGLVVSEKQGRSRYWRLSETGLAPVHDWLAGQTRLWSARLDQFETYALHLHERHNDGT